MVKFDCVTSSTTGVCATRFLVVNYFDRRVKRAFSLLELCLSLSVLGLLAGVLSWQTSDLFQGHRLQEGIKTLVIEVKQMQSLALSHRTDFELAFNYDTKEKSWYYTCITDEPISYLPNKQKIALAGVRSISIQGKKKAPLYFSVHSSGRITPLESICFQGKKKSYWVDFSSSPQIKLFDEKPKKTS